MEEKSHGQLAFEAYSAQVGGTTYDGKPIPRWDALSDNVRAGWEAAGVAVADDVHYQLLTETADRYVNAVWGRYGLWGVVVVVLLAAGLLWWFGAA